MTVKMPKAGLFDAQGKLTAAGHHYLEELGRQAGGGTGSSGGFTTFDEPIFVEIPQDGTKEIIIDRGFAGTIDSVSTKCQSGSCTVAVLVDGAAIGAGNSATTSLQTLAQEAAFGDGSTWALSISFNAACIGLSVNIGYTRTS
jgi:hypothetical protein